MARKNNTPTSNGDLRTETRGKLIGAMAAYRGPVDFPSKAVAIDTLSEISSEAIRQAMIALVIMFNLPSGSSGDLKLYELGQAYFLDSDFRAEVNGLMAKT